MYTYHITDPAEVLKEETMTYTKQTVVITLLVTCGKARMQTFRDKNKTVYI